MQYLPADGSQRRRWKNDGGWTTELARFLADAADDKFDWRLSLADIEADGPFSSFPGVRRELMLVAGDGLELDVAGTAPQRLHRRFAATQFAGDVATTCRLLDGPVRVSNLMMRADDIEAQLLGRPLADAMLLLPEAGCQWLVHLLEGRAQAEHAGQVQPMAPGDSLLLDWREQKPERAVIKGAGELLLAKFRWPGTGSSGLAFA